MTSMNGNDAAEITNVINLYAVAVDSLQWDLFDDVFTDDIAIDFGGPAAFTGIDTLKVGFDAIHRPFKATQHFTSNHHIAINGDRATCFSYVRGVFVREVAGGNMFESTGWYDDVLIRTPAGWRIQTRSSRMTWWGGNPEVLKTNPQAGVPEDTDSMAAEAEAGRLAHVKGLLGG